MLIIQAIAVMSGAIPVYLLSKTFDFSNIKSMFISAAYLFYPGIVAPLFYDFHENKFVVALLLWMFYFYEKGKISLTYISMLLVLLVKEDAALYIIFWGLFVWFEKKDSKNGGIILAVSTLYFIAVTTGLQIFGRGIMSQRFSVYLLPDQNGLIDVVKNIFMNPVYYGRIYLADQDVYDETKEVLSEIPEDAIVISDTFYTPHLSHVKELYMYPMDINADYLVFKENIDSETDKLDFINSGNYQLVEETKIIKIYKKDI